MAGAQCAALCGESEGPPFLAALPSGPEEHEPDDGKNQDRKPGRDGEQRRHRRARFALACLSRSFDDPMVLARCHGDLNLWIVASEDRDVITALCLQPTPDPI